MAFNKPSTKDIVIGVGLLVVFVIAMLLVLNIYKQEGQKRSAAISSEGAKKTNYIEIFVKLLSVDPTKGDVSARLEFVPHGTYEKENGALAQPLKLFVNSATGKQEHDFPKDKRMNPVDVTISLYDGLVTDYPFDRHSGFLELYFSPAKPEKKEGASPPATNTSSNTSPANPSAATPATSPTPAEGSAAQGGGQPAEKKDETAKKDEAAKKEEPSEFDDDIPIDVDFFGSIPGLKIEAEKTKDTDDNYVGIDMTIQRSGTVKFFSLFIAVLMWGATIGVLLLVMSILLRGRKIEVGMFSFLSALLFAMVAVRNSQPGVPPIGTFSDFISFFWAEVILALCLMAILFTWLLRPTAK